MHYCCARAAPPVEVFRLLSLITTVLLQCTHFENTLMSHLYCKCNLNSSYVVVVVVFFSNMRQLSDVLDMCTDAL